MISKQEWLAAVQATIAQAAIFVTGESMEDVHQLADHGEPAEAIYVLAWVIVNSETNVPAALVSAIRDHAQGFDVYDLLPQNLDAFAI
jgi:hypothetical protein